MRSSLKKAAGECKNCSNWKEIRQRLRVSQLLETAINKIEQRFAEKEFKPTMAEYLKLMQMEQELTQSAEDIKEVKVTWVDPVTSSTEK